VERRLGRGNHLARIQQLEVERGRQVRVVQPGLARPHGVLVRSEQRQPLADECLQGVQRLFARDGPGEAVQAARVCCKPGVDQRQYLARQGVWDKGRAGRQGARTRFAESLAVVWIEVPLPADRIIALHQHAMSLALFAVEILHAQGLATLGVSGEFTYRGEEVTVLPDLQGHATALGNRLDGLQHAPFAGRCHHQPLGLQLLQVGLQLRGQATVVVWCVQRRVVQPAPGRLQGQREMTHRRQEQGDARSARPHVGGFLGDLGHPHGIPVGVKAVKS